MRLVMVQVRMGVFARLRQRWEITRFTLPVPSHVVAEQAVQTQVPAHSLNPRTTDVATAAWWRWRG